MTAVHEQPTPPAADEVGAAAPPRRATQDRSRARRILAPTATAFGVVIATGIVARVDPNEPGHYPLCPTLAILGIDCPACGGLRATHALANGDIVRAMDHNLLFVLLVPAIIVGWAVWFWRSWTGKRGEDSPRKRALAKYGPLVLLLVLVAFGIVRNFVPYLGSGVG